MKIKYFDTHSHYNIKPLNELLDEHFAILNEKNIFVNVVGTNIEDSMIAIDIAKKYHNAIASIGIHPSEAKSKDDLKSLEKLYLDNKEYVKAIGECGIDYHYQDLNKENQKFFFVEQIKLAIKYGLTLVLHIRDAHQDALEILNDFDLSNIKVIIHCYTDKLEFAKYYVKKGFFISIPGVVTFKNALDVKEVSKWIPLNLLLTETDAPFLAPVPNRGKINQSTNLCFTNEYIASLRAIDNEQLNEQLIKNACIAFNLKL